VLRLKRRALNDVCAHRREADYPSPVNVVNRYFAMFKYWYR
jgi:hypothetical protein